MVRRLRLAMLSVHSSPIGSIGTKDTGGMSIYIREVAAELGKMGLPVDIYTRATDHNHGQVVDLSDNVRLVHLRAGEKSIDKLAVYPHLPTFAGNLEDFRKKNNLHYDLVFSHYWLSGWVGRCLQRCWQVPHLMMFHTMGAVKNTLGIGETEPELRITTERELAQNSQGIIASTERERADIVRHYRTTSDKIKVIPCGVDLTLFQPQDRDQAKQQLGLAGERVVLFVGRIEPLKGLDRLIMAMTFLPEERRPKLVIIGGDEHSQQEVERLKALSGELGVAASVAFLGRIKHEELPRFYCAADVCVVPSYYESFGLVALESLACGTPVVATNVGNLSNIIRQGETGFVAANNDPRRLADGISLMLSKSNGNGNATSIRASVTAYSWSRIAPAVLAECREVLAGNYS